MTLTHHTASGARRPDRLVPEGHGLLAPPGSPDCWELDDEAVLECSAVLDITHDVKTFVFRPPGNRVFHFEPGQFLTLRLDVTGQPVNRCYTISSPPTRPHRVAITVKRVPGGLVSNWLHDTVRRGTRVRSLAPLGAFTLPTTPTGKYLFLSAGSGVTPLMSMTRTLHDLGADADVVFVHSARSPADIVFRDELATIAAVAPGIRVVHVCESDHPSQPWRGLRGRLSTDMVRTLAPDLHQRHTFTCGPAAYMSSVRRILCDLDYDMLRYHEESFSFEALEQPAPAATARPAVDGFQVELVRSGRSISCRPDENVLDAALAAGLRLPSSCTQGMCGTCKTTKLAGEVEMHHNGGIRPREIAQDQILICCSKPRSDLSIDA